MNYKKWVPVAVSLFSIGLVLGLAIPPDLSLATETLTSLEEFSRLLTPFSILTVLLIFVKNASALVFSFILSPLLCLVPVISLTINGCIISLVSAMVVQEQSLGFLLAGLIPHGIFELPAFIIGQAAALSFGAMAILALFSKKKRGLLPGSLKQNLKYLVLALLLLLPAAIIETYVTPWLLT